METKKINFRAIILIFLAVAAGVVFLALNQQKTLRGSFEPAMLEVGRPAPDFTLPGLDGKMVSLSDYRGKVVLVNIWATWCPPCIAEMPSMEKLYQQLKGDPFEILAVSLDTPGAGAVAPFMKKHNLSFPALIDSQGITKIAYRATGVPESFIVNQQGVLAKIIIGPINWAAPDTLSFFRQLLHNSRP
jgi:peroxiredoxin